MNYRPGEADIPSMLLKSLLAVFVVGVFCGGMAFAIWAIGSVFWPIGLYF